MAFGSTTLPGKEPSPFPFEVSCQLCQFNLTSRLSHVFWQAVQIWTPSLIYSWASGVSLDCNEIPYLDSLSMLRRLSRVSSS